MLQVHTMMEGWNTSCIESLPADCWDPNAIAQAIIDLDMGPDGEDPVIEVLSVEVKTMTPEVMVIDINVDHLCGDGTTTVVIFKRDQE